MNVKKNEKSLVSLAGVSLPVSQAMVLNCIGTVSGNYDTLKLNGTPYLVPAGYELHILAQKIHNLGANGLCSTEIGFSTAIATNQAGAPTAYSKLTDGAGFAANTAGATAESIMFCKVDAGKYATAKSAGSPSTMFLCRLVKV